MLLEDVVRPWLAVNTPITGARSRSRWGAGVDNHREASSQRRWKWRNKKHFFKVKQVRWSQSARLRRHGSQIMLKTDLW